ncbi:MAG: hypothetical protein CSB44_11605 [Gammaproteobacteria bacterium]|nr:MAG: hypothetical protein CSB44_11605 [Gammaproteobacteria bacterium]
MSVNVRQGLALALLGAAVGVAAGWRLADRRAEVRQQLVVAELAETLSQEYAFEIDRLRAHSDDDAERLAIAEASIAALETRLAASLEQDLADARELALYRRIAAADMPSGLAVDEVSLVGGEKPALLVTLVQSQGRNRAQGKVGLDLLLTEAGTVGSEIEASEPAVETIVLLEPDSEDAPSFDMRFFQSIRLPLERTDFPDNASLRITVQPEGKRYKRFVKRIPWQQLALAD